MTENNLGHGCTRMHTDKTVCSSSVSTRVHPWLIFAVLAAATALSASQTKTWTLGEFADYEKGVLKNLSVRSDGLLTLAPKSHELFDPATAYLWALARDSKGNLYAGGGTTAKLFRVPPDGKGKLL